MRWPLLVSVGRELTGREIDKVERTTLAAEMKDSIVILFLLVSLATRISNGGNWLPDEGIKTEMLQCSDCWIVGALDAWIAGCLDAG